MRDRLSEYVLIDEVYQKYKKGELKKPNDFELFCIQHCKDIEKILKEHKKCKNKLKKIESFVEGFAQAKFEHDKILCGKELEELWAIIEEE